MPYVDSDYPYGHPSREYSENPVWPGDEPKQPDASSRVMSGVHLISGMVAGVGGALALYSLGNNIADAVQAKEPEKKALSGVKATLNAGSAVGAAGAVTDSLAQLGVVARAAAAWTAVLGYILFPFQAIGLALNSYDTVLQGTKLYTLNTIASSQSQEMRLLSGLEVVKERDLERIQWIMQRIRTSSGVDQREAVKEGEKLLAELKSRVTKDLAIATASVALGIAGIALGIFAIVASGGLALVAAGIAVGVVAVGVSIYKHVHQHDVEQKQATRQLEDRIRREVEEKYRLRMGAAAAG